MWKKEDAEKRATSGDDSAERARPARRSSGERAAIGRSITIRGDVTGDEDLLIEGRVEGSVDLKQHKVTVGPDGEVKANITGRVVTVEGHVEGDLHADEQIVLKSSARVLGDISAPRVQLEDGAYFRGGVEMAESESGRKGGTSSSSGSSYGSSSSPSSSVGSSSTGSTGSGGSSSSGGSSGSGEKSKAGQTG